MQPSQLLGSLIDGKYKIHSVLGQGGMGTVYRAHQQELSRDVVIKVLNFNLSSDNDFIKRFHREARILAALKNEHLVQVYASGQLAGDVPYLVMEYVEGKPLSELLQEEGKLPWQRVFKIGVQICEAMEVVHSEGILHRDLKPSNIMILNAAGADFVKVIDFGLGCFLGADSTTLTKDGTMLGSPQYMSPEVCSGAKSDQASDIYSLACIMHECIAGERPFKADNPVALIYQHKSEIPPLLASNLTESATCSISVNAIILKGMEKSLDKRYRSMTEFKSVLSKYISDQTIEFDPTAVTGLSNIRGTSTAWKKLLPSIAIGALCLGGMAVFAIHFFSGKESANRDAVATVLGECSAMKREALAAEAKHNILRAKDLAHKSLRIFAKELCSKRDYKEALKAELSLMDEFQELGHLLDIINSRHLFGDLIPLEEQEKRLQNYHNLGELLVLNGKVETDATRSIDCYLRASKAFSMNREIDVARSCVDTARQRAEEKYGKEIEPSILSRLLIAEATISLEEGNKNKFAELVSDAEKNLNLSKENVLEKASIHAELGELFQKSGDFENAAASYKQTLSELNYSLGSPPKGIPGNDAIYKQAWQGLAEIAENRGDVKLATTAYEKLAEHANVHSDLPAYSAAEAKVEKLRSVNHSR